MPSSVKEGVPLKEALATAKRNEFGRVLGRDAPNRIEPECWPVVKPSFQFSKDQKFFTIGSCFAGNIARRLAADGYNVHGGGEQRPRYTPASIFQEIDWAGRIFRRDGIVRQEDVEPLLLESEPGKFLDLWSRSDQGGDAVDMATAIERRQSLYEYLGGAFQADVVVVTLGLIETWFDSVSNSFVEFDGSWLRRRDRDRFTFHVLTFDQCKDFIRRTLELLLTGDRRALITTSPVVLSRTFTDKDIIIANNHSKSVLRAVAGELSDELDGVDYFPSYEIATIGPRQQVWEDDLRHVKPNFVARIMQHVTNFYVPGSVGDDAAELMTMASLVDSREFDRAQGIYDRCSASAASSTDQAVQVAAVRLGLHRGDVAIAVRHALAFDPGDRRLYSSHPDWMLDVARAFGRSSEHRELGEKVLATLKNVCESRPAILKPFLINRERARDPEGVAFALDVIESVDLDDPSLVARAALKLQDMAEIGRALALLERQLAKSPANAVVLARYARILLSDRRSGDAIKPLRTLAKVEEQSVWVHLALARSLYNEGLYEEALSEADCLLQLKPGDGEGLLIRSRALAKLGRPQDAAENARAASTVSNVDPRIISKLQVFLDA